MWVFGGKYNMIFDFQREVWWGGGVGLNSNTLVMQKTITVHATKMLTGQNQRYNLWAAIDALSLNSLVVCIASWTCLALGIDSHYRHPLTLQPTPTHIITTFLHKMCVYWQGLYSKYGATKTCKTCTDDLNLFLSFPRVT